MCKAMEDMRKESLQEGLQEGIKEGIKKGAVNTAMRMLTAGKYALEEIANISGLPLDEVRKLKTEQTI